MGLRCLLGHDFGEPELRREREEEGDEVVTTVKEVKTCARCGETQIVSENTEVTTMEQLADEAAADADAGSDAGATATPGGGPAPDAGDGAAPGTVDGDGAAAGAEGLTLDEEPGAGSDDAVILDDGAAGDDEAEPPRGDDGPADPSAAGASDAAAESDPADEDAELLDAGGESAAASSSAADAEPEDRPTDEADAETDDGVILDEGTADADDDRERGAWPSVDEADAEAGGSTAWPDHGGEDEGFSAEVGEGGDAEVEFGDGLTPEAADRPEDGEQTEYVEAPDDGEAVSFDAGDPGETGITRGESPDLETMGDDEPTEYYCPECGMVRAAGGSSMRAGDICPECKRGYVDERPR
ncbi:DUF7093 family protein [Halorubrum tropicale]|uniref:Uncharacterized protein n=1 Tax=Halorubrum tropicale TaxID=1765655 RepID=A0A0M9ARX2_9EURY|nr:hypothetical protein [Halorubrum tropicale]KOX97522.1 hypothetical protein AMR74_01045 [Halorubrum tropicale]